MTINIQHILVICVGNICRSPMAEYFLKQQFPQFNIQSAGLNALVGKSADPKAIHCMDQYNIDIRSHTARQVTDQLIKWADIILVMTQNQQNYIENLWPFAYGKTFRLGHWQHQNIKDPYQHDQIFFNETCCLIRSFLLDWQYYLSR